MQNSCVIWNENTKNAAVTDPGGDLDKINDFLSKNNLNLVKIFITHGHLDHAGGAFNLSQEHDVKIEGPHPDDEFLITGLEDQGKMYGVPGTKNFLPDRWLDDDTTFVPGHGPLSTFGQEKKTNPYVADQLFKD
jgi:glyoxylase-like metal-dependent hydrolase (beta-lactamase superfamily II)